MYAQNYHCFTPLYAWARFWSYPATHPLCMRMHNVFAPSYKCKLAHNQLVNISEKLPPLNNFAEDGRFFTHTNCNKLKTYDANVIFEWAQNLSLIDWGPM